MSGDQGLEYLPEGFRDGGRGHHDSADHAAETSRAIGRVTASGSHFGGGGASSFASSLSQGASDRAESARRASENRDELGRSGYAVAAQGEDMDLEAQRLINTQASYADPTVADGI